MGNINENRKLMIKQIASFRTVNESGKYDRDIKNLDTPKEFEKFIKKMKSKITKNDLKDIVEEFKSLELLDYDLEQGDTDQDEYDVAVMDLQLSLTNSLTENLSEGMGMTKGKDNRLMIDLENIIGSEVEHTTKKNGRVSVITSFSIPGGKNVLEVEESYDGIWVVTLRAKKGMKIWANEFEFGFSDIEDEATAMKAAMKMVKKHVNLFR